jgi:hypothetical protein
LKKSTSVGFAGMGGSGVFICPFDGQGTRKSRDELKGNFGTASKLTKLVLNYCEDHGATPILLNRDSWLQPVRQTVTCSLLPEKYAAQRAAYFR